MSDDPTKSDIAKYIIGILMETKQREDAEQRSAELRRQLQNQGY